MKPTDKEIEEAFGEEEEAFKEWACVRGKVDSWSLKEIAARKRLTLARHAKAELMRDALNY